MKEGHQSGIVPKKFNTNKGINRGNEKQNLI